MVLNTLDGNWGKKYPFDVGDPKDGSINTQMVIKSIDEHLSNRRFRITTGVGNHQMWAAQFIKYSNPKTYISSGSLGVMGAGLPYAIGAQFANPDKKVVLLDGDGSFKMTLNDLGTIAENNLQI